MSTEQSNHDASHNGDTAVGTNGLASSTSEATLTEDQHPTVAMMPADLPDRSIFVTCALPYANGPIHLGHLLEHIQADIWTRYQKMRGHSCLFLCADDAHGTPIMLRAEKDGLTPEALIEKMHTEHLRDLRGFLINYDNYHTTHSPENQALANLVYERNKSAGYIKTKTIQQLYDPERGMFLADRYVKGICPKCGAEEQNGDNCDKCGATYAPTDLKSPKSVVSGATPVLKDVEQLFFDLPQFENTLDAWLSGPALQPEVANKLREWHTAGLQPWDISREAPYFGFEIPDQPGKYFYVWMDAPIGYMASHKHYCQKHPAPLLSFEEVWQQPSNVELYHFIGKDIVNFHGLFWPSMLTGAEFRVPTGIFVHGFVSVNGQKMSKSTGNFITAETYLANVKPEYLRYYFATKLTAKVHDLDMNLEDFTQRCNSDLVGKFVNIASRCAPFLIKNFDAQLASELSNPALIENLQSQAALIASFYEQREFSRAMREIMALADAVNQYIDARAPWQMIKDETQQDAVQAVCTTGLNAFRLLMLYLKPVLPEVAAAAEQFLNIGPLQWADRDQILLNHKINKFNPLIARLDKKQVGALVAESGETKNTAAQKTKQAKKDKKQKSDPLPEGTIAFDDFAKVDLRVAKILSAKNVEGSDKLLQVQVDLGDEQRCIFAGIRSAYKAEELEGRLTVIVANLAPRKMRFGVSEGMILAAGPGGETIFLLSPDSGATPGMKVM